MDPFLNMTAIIDSTPTHSSPSKIARLHWAWQHLLAGKRASLCPVNHFKPYNSRLTCKAIGHIWLCLRIITLATLVWWTINQRRLLVQSPYVICINLKLNCQASQSRICALIVFLRNFILLVLSTQSHKFINRNIVVIKLQIPSCVHIIHC